MKIIGIDIGTTTISGVVLENKVEGQITTKAEEKLEIVEAKTIENGCFIPTEHEWERIQDAEQIVKKAQNLTDYFLDKYHIQQEPAFSNIQSPSKLSHHTYGGL